MAKTLFGKVVNKCCSDCVHSTFSGHSEIVLCAKKGFVDKTGKCFRFRYDPLKRVPKKTSIYDDVSAEDFKL